MDRFGIRAEGAVISNDGDVLGTAARAHELALLLRAKCRQPAPASRGAIVAQLRLPTAGGKERNIDVLRLLYTVSGLRKSSEFTKRVIAGSVRVKWHNGTQFRVMDPFDVLESRVQNAAGLLQDKGPHVLTQARWAIEVAKAALLQLAANDQEQPERLGHRLQGIYTLAHSRPGRNLLRDHQIEVLEAIDLSALRKAAPLHEKQLQNVQAALEKRRGAKRRPAPAG
ncbi:hypothetical protein [Caldimonas brevitalea]|uniref:Uncharacterized protein n=1 Tax=Caldimonas brevitalea TaxID=413882 RepID=A0A0G3BJW7_9BURK|nr:hypothetical protein [Caldimonas brevitalea]AKJ27691.1 hypothetical protein AAW51_1000 [Caldimonas brevitalea]